jgi:anti-sigma B factor antagonist
VVDIHVLELHGEIDISRQHEIEKKLGQIELFGRGSVTILDLTDVRYADTTLLNALVKTQKDVASLPGGGIFIVAPKHIARIFEITALDQVFPMFDDALSARRHASRSELAISCSEMLSGFETQ